MNVTLPEKEKLSKQTITIYVVVAIICVLAVIVVVGVQVLGNDVINNLFGINKLAKRTEQEEATLIANFESILDNKIDDKGNYRTQKLDESKEIIYNNYSKDTKTDKYEINVNLPYINIKNKEVQDFNDEVKNTFESKAEEIVNKKEGNTLYTVKYKATVEKNILSVIIYSDLKQNSDAQRVIARTFNYNLDENKTIPFENMLKIYGINKNKVQNKINENIKIEQKKAKDLQDLGYNVFSRDINDEIYKLENISEYFIYNNNIYVIFAYGNEKLASEMDIVII